VVIVDEGKEYLVGGRKIERGRGAWVEVLEAKEQLLGHQHLDMIEARVLRMLRKFSKRGTPRFVKQDNKLRYFHILLCHAVMISAIHASRQGGVFETPSCAPTALYYALTTTANAPICTLAAKVPQPPCPTLHASYIIWDALNSR
jgi:hypothetical protein